MTWLTFDWENQKYNFTSAVRTTKLYKDGVFQEARTADPNGAYVEAWSDNGWLSGIVNHSIENPFCTGGAITYNVQLSVSHDGMFDVRGYRRPAPHHELYSGSNTDGLAAFNWYPLMLRDNHGFGCLADPPFTCPEQQLYGEHTYNG